MGLVFSLPLVALGAVLIWAVEGASTGGWILFLLGIAMTVASLVFPSSVEEETTRRDGIDDRWSAPARYAATSLYPAPRTLTIHCGFAGSGSILRRRFEMWTSQTCWSPT